MTTATRTDRYLLDDDLVADPYPYLAELRAAEPVHWSPVHRAWLVTGYDAATACYTEPAISADRIGPMLAQTPPDLLSPEAARAFSIMAGWMVFVDPPEHRRLRAVFRGAFGARQVRRNRPMVQEAVTRLAVRAGAGDVIDLVTEFARPLPATVAAAWMGVPVEDTAMFQRWAIQVGDLALGAVQSPEEHERSQRALLDLFDYLRALVRARRAAPREDLISAALANGLVGESVSEDEFVAMLTHVAFAGGETTSNLIAVGTWNLLRHPDQLALLRADPELAPVAVEELLRFDGPSKMSIRHVRDDVELAGARLRAGQRLYVVTAGANRDPSRFDRPDELDLRRQPNPHLGFGQGGHFCLGAPLARLVAGAALTDLLAAAPALALATTGARWQPSLLNRSLQALPVRL
ncbi:cytochrome P450 [Micromonospora sp. WMMD1128]|uniref:cytochrome P450 n=1 Tax=unclassified Micromonospora TaxID=2617518 RepID=UPI00248CE6DC|nr:MULTISPECIES: cytochrome P450 [unclassified Micromonospora]WBB75898.1 cytochrome P450 [Micromonospora sp. WMMD1128]WFE36316.1 cytochrome P450 [Micromonospora sp. WMMD975]